MFEKILRVMLEAKWEIKSVFKELIEIYYGKLNIKIAGNKNWKLITDNINFNILNILKYAMRF